MGSLGLGVGSLGDLQLRCTGDIIGNTRVRSEVVGCCDADGDEEVSTTKREISP